MNYNVKFFLEQCLCSVIKACENISSEIIIIDNHSTDGSQDFFSNKFPTVKFIWHPENLGFGKANNLALQSATGKYILFLNPDTILPEDSIHKSLAFFQSNKNVGGLGVRMIDGSGQFLKESKRAFPSSATAFFKLSGLTALLPKSKIFARYYLGHLDEHESHVVDVLAGAYMMIPKAVLDKVGSFDEAFFMYGEDVDLSYRIQKAGFDNYYFAGTTIIHFKGESTKKETSRYIRLFYGAMELFVRKHFSSIKATVFCMLIRGAIGFKIAMNGLKKKPRKSTDTIKTISLEQQLLLVVTGNQENETVGRLIKQSGIKNAIVENIVGNDLQNNADLLSKKIQQHQPTGTVFYADSHLSYATIISLMELIKPSVDYWFYSAGTSAVVGSSDKDSIGNFLPVNFAD